MNRSERRARERQQRNSAAALHKRADRTRSSREALEIAQRLFQLGRGADALPGLDRAVRAHPDDVELRGAFAYALASSGRLSLAIDQYKLAADLNPESAPLLTNLAVLLAKTGHQEEAREKLERAVKLAPEHANTVFALAELLANTKRKGEAFHHYRRAAVLFRKKVGSSPGVEHCDDLVKLATAQMWTGDIEPGLRSLELAVELRPDHVHALSERAMALSKLRRVPEAITLLRRAAALAPDMAEPRRALGEVLRDQGDLDAAEREYRAALRIDPTDELAKYYLAAVKHESPDAPPPVYVRRLFDEYADTFEHHLVDILKYRAPEQVCEAVLAVGGAAAADWQVIDLGCGTGLCGPLIRNAAAHLVGVDLSAGMLEEARNKAVYDELRLGDVAEVLGSYAAAFDLALCCDVMIYLGSLTPIFSAAADALKPGALFGFTTEVHSGDGFVVDVSGRYLHSRGYVEDQAASHGFAVVHFEPIVARYQHQEPDIHHLYVVRREGSTG